MSISPTKSGGKISSQNRAESTLQCTKLQKISKRMNASSCPRDQAVK